MAEPRIISTSGEAFSDRAEAGRMLAEHLSEYGGKAAVILGIPRGGVVVAAELAGALQADLDILISRKLRSPGYPELAMGSISEDGQVFLNESVLAQLNAGKDEIENEKSVQMSEIKRRSELVRKSFPKIPLKGRLVVITDDGVATGATFQTALRAARGEGAEKLVAAIPVGARESLTMISRYADDVVCLRVPPYFAAVGQFYRRFEAVEDEDVLRIMRWVRERDGAK